MEETAVDSQNNRDRARRKTRGKFDYSLFIVVLMLLVFGLVMVYSTSYYTANLNYGDPAYWLKRQGAFAVLGIGAMLFIANIDYHVWRPFAMLGLLIVDAMLILVLLIGEDVNGAKRWLRIGGVNFQPSEVAKVVIIVCFAALLNRYGRKIREFKYLAIVCLCMLPTIALVGIENLSTSIILMAIIGIMLFVDYPKLLPLIATGIAGVGVAVIFFFAKGYRGSRIDAWLDPETTDNGYQTLQSLYAIGSGGLTGKGLGQSLQKLGFIPEAHNDMIFSIICEELGFVGAIGVISLFIVLIFRMVKIALNAKDLLGSLIVVGSIAHIGIQVLINVAVVTNTIPNTGVPLPFISYGGTSVVFLLVEMGIVLSVARYIYWEK